MAHTEVLLLEPLKGKGNEGDCVSVASGYARNHLFPHGKAIPVNRANRKYVDALQARKEARYAKVLADANELKSKLEALKLVIRARVGESGRMFGAITAQHVLEAIEAEGIALPQKSLQIGQPIKVIGQHKAQIRLHPEVAMTFLFDIVAQDDEEETEA